MHKSMYPPKVLTEMELAALERLNKLCLSHSVTVSLVL